MNGANCPACDVFSFADGTFSMYDEWMDGAVPVPSRMIPFKIYIHVGTDYVNAWFSSSSGVMAFGDGKPSCCYPLTTADVTSHEIAHAFTDMHSDLVYSSEAGGILVVYRSLFGLIKC